MAKRKESAGNRERVKVRQSWDPESFKYYFPVLLAVMIAAVVILFHKFIFSDQMLYGSDTINAGIFFRHLYVEYVKMHGSVPLWNPYIFGGLPFIDAFHGDIFYPLSVLKFFGNLYRMLGWNLVIHILLAGVFMYFTARQFRLSRLASTFSAVGYMFTGLLVSLVAPGHDGKIFVATLFPLTILFLDRAFERKPVLNFTLLGLVIGVIILSPHPQLSYYSLWAIALYGLFKLVLLYLDTRRIATLLKPGGLLAGAVIIGLLISAVQFYPGYIYTTNYSPRADTKRGYDWATSWSMHEEEAVSLVVPEFSGSSSGENNYYWGKNPFKDNSEYAGIIPLFFAIIAVFFYRRKEAIFFGGLSLFALVYALGGTTPIFRIFYYLIPNVRSLRAPSTIMFIFAFGVCLLAGMGLQYLIDRGRQLTEKSRKKLNTYFLVVPGILLLFAFLFAIAGESLLSIYSSIFYSNIKIQAIGQGNLTKWNLALMNLPNIKSGLWIVFLLTAAASGVAYLYLSRKTQAAILFALPLLALVDGIRFDSHFISTYDYRQQTTPTEITNYMSALPGKFRIFNLSRLPQDYLPFFDLEVVTGYHGNQLRWYDDLLGGPSLTNQSNRNVLNLIGTRYILAPPAGRLPEHYFGPESLTLEKDWGQIALFKNPNAFPRAFVVTNFEIVPDRKNIYPLILSGKSDLRRLVYLEEDPPITVSSGDSSPPPAEITSYADDSVVVDVHPTENSILVLTDNYYPSWDAYVNGVRTPILRAYGVFRAVPIKAGTDRVIFKYNASLNNRAFLITLFALTLVALVLLYYLYLYLRTKKRVAAAI